jgi:hypothetical protein
MLPMTVCDCEVTVTLIGMAETSPLESSAITKTVCRPGAAKICVLMEFEDV